ncbi:hypothetical protein GCM10010353_43670 [Streptomyces chryseus]|nr:hypothetical protein GCM10010353_43670 [Streptomyces chryseus]
MAAAVQTGSHFTEYPGNEGIALWGTQSSRPTMPERLLVPFSDADVGIECSRPGGGCSAASAVTLRNPCARRSAIPAARWPAPWPGKPGGRAFPRAFGWAAWVKPCGGLIGEGGAYGLPGDE